MGGVVVLRWTDNMAATVKVVPGERILPMPAGTLPRTGGELTPPRESRDIAAKRRNPFKATPESIASGKALFAIYCSPCHGPAGKGDGTVTPKFIPPPDVPASLRAADRRLLARHHTGSRDAGLREALSPESAGTSSTTSDIAQK
jgi:mono/diheme cytochrome c family protein